MKDKTVVQMVNTLEMVGFIKTNGTQCRFVSLVCDTEPKLKVGCPFKGVRKVARKIGLVNANYNTSVRNRIADKLGVKLNEVEYASGEVWYQHLLTSDGKPLPLVVNKTKNDGKHYLQYFPHASMNAYVMPNGDTVTEAQLEPWLYKRSERPDYKPCVIAIDLANVRKLAASGVIIEMPDFEEAAQALETVS